MESIPANVRFSNNVIIKGELFKKRETYMPKARKSSAHALIKVQNGICSPILDVYTPASREDLLEKMRVINVGDTLAVRGGLVQTNADYINLKVSAFDIFTGRNIDNNPAYQDIDFFRF